MRPFEIRVRDLMSTALVTVKPSDNVVSARAEMEVGVMRHLPVVDERRRLVGVLSDRNLIHVRPNKYVADVMTRDVLTVKPEAPASEAASIMLDHMISSVLVVDDAGTLVGVVTQTDFLELARRSLLGLPLER